MKYAIPIILFVCGFTFLPRNNASFSSKTSLTDSVYICDSEGSYAYHSYKCSGLSRCKQEIKKMTLQDAVKSGHEKPCGYCYN